MKELRISYAITVCNEAMEIQRLVDFLLKHKRQCDEIVVLFDRKNGTVGVEEYLRTHSVNGEFNWAVDDFANDFGAWKNKLNDLCTGDFIFQIDADEMITTDLMEDLPEILKSNETTDLFHVPRINTVSGITSEHINKWHWKIDDRRYINFPDYQRRIYRNIESIYWVNKVHEVIAGHRNYASLPAVEKYCLIHHKTIERQEKQNSLYDRI